MTYGKHPVRRGRQHSSRARFVCRLVRARFTRLGVSHSGTGSPGVRCGERLRHDRSTSKRLSITFDLTIVDDTVRVILAEKRCEVMPGTLVIRGISPLEAEAALQAPRRRRLHV